MLFALSSDHHVFFEKHQFIEFEALLNAEQIEELRNLLEKALIAKLNPPSGRATSKDPFQAGYDLHLKDSRIKKVTHKTAFATLAAELSHLHIIRFGFDLYISDSRKTTAPFEGAKSLQETSCLAPLAGALIFPLKDTKVTVSSFPLPSKTGNALFIAPTFPIPWAELLQRQDLCWLLIGFATKRTFFKADTQDPLAHEFKREGYVFNDQLREPLHPILKRQ